MSPSTSLSQAARQTGDSPISELMARALATPDLVSLAAGFVDHASLPVEPTAEILADMLGDEVEGRRALQYGTTRGDTRLRKHLVRLIESSEHAPEGTYDHVLDRVVVTTGSQQLLYLVAEALLDPGDIVLVESPTYFVFLGVLKGRGARIIGVETDEGGLRVDALERTLADLDARGDLDRVKLIYTISEHSNPTGLCLAADRRRALVEVAKTWSKRQRIYVLEDAAYRGLTFEGTEPPSVWSTDEDGDTVILARTFSKTYSPGLKLGFGVLPHALVAPVLGLKGNHDFGSAQFSQQIIDAALEGGHYARQVERLTRTYLRKRDVMLEALAESFAPWGESVRWTRPRGGLYVWMTLPEGIDTGRHGAFFDACLDEGVLYVPGEYAYPAEGVVAPPNQARLTFGVTPEPGLVQGVRRLAAALEHVQDGGRRPAASTPRMERSAVTPA